jgi:hypothetical protein
MIKWQNGVMAIVPNYGMFTGIPNRQFAIQSKTIAPNRTSKRASTRHPSQGGKDTVLHITASYFSYATSIISDFR